MRMETGFNIKKRHISCVTIALLSVAVCLSMAAADDDYRFIIDDSSYPTANIKVARGGAWNGESRLCRAAFRHAFDPSTRSAIIGFRVACTAGLK